ncbi:protein ycf15 [Musa troglodytarum]|uniref:Protein ycf15 n=1 Tax=Musa troglodytarum TaxID=320322 RepID=A0A9E7EUC1_9LILI|nr:protein ycf15 [Musa troglodytarum]
MTKRYWILFRIGPERRRKAGMPTDVCLQQTSVYSLIHPTRSILGTSSAKVTEWVSRQSLKRTI